MNASEARALLLAQHDRIRHQMALCVRLAHDQRAGEPVDRELDEALGELRDEFAEHNAAETEIIGEIMRGPAAWGSRMVARMCEEHLAEHIAFWALLCGTQAEVTERIHELADELDAHMAAEERTFLAPVTLRDDVIHTRTRDLTSS